MTTYRVPSSDPSKPSYEVTRDDTGYLECPCKGFLYRNKCRHTKSVEAGEVQPEGADYVEPVDGGDVSFDTEALEGNDENSEAE